jgi:peptidoglycan biosynthesis protein MviN/MurJ (putative lipid II flippase)
MLAIGLVLLLAAKQAAIGAIAAVLSALVFLCGRFFFPVYDRMDGFVAATARLAGIILTWLLLVPFFGLVFVPAKALIALSRKDPLCRRFRTEHKTFWVSHPDRIPGGYERQY